MKKLSYLAALAAALVFSGSQTAYSACPVGQPCPNAAPASAPMQTQVNPCPCDPAKPCPCQNAPSSSMSIADTLNAQACFKTFSRLMQQAGIAKILKGKGPYTVFAPTDAAFCKLPAGTVERLMCPENKCELEKLIRYHIVTENVPCSKLNCPTTVKTSEGRCLSIVPKCNKLYVNNAEIYQGDICTKNGIIYTIDNVLCPAD